MLIVKRAAMLLAVLLFVASCATNSPDESNAAPTEDLSALDSGAPGADASLEADLKDSAAKPNDSMDASTPADVAKDAVQDKTQNGQDDFAQFDDNKNDKPADTQAQNKPADGQDDFAQFDDKKEEQQPPPPVVEATQPPPPVVDNPPPPVVDAPPVTEPPPVVEPPPEVAAKTEIPEPKNEPPPVPEAPAEAQTQAAASNLVRIKDVLFKGNDSGGTIIVEADGPMTYSTRMNSNSGQFVVDIPNSVMARKSTRPIVTRDFEGSIGAIDAYQNRGSNVARIVVHLKPGAVEPVIQNEGSSLLIVASDATKESKEPVAEVKLLSSNSLEEFLAGNMTFSGKRISIETDDMEMRDLFKLISEEGGVNLVIADEVKGKMSVKLRQVPWDQALVMVMKAKKLSYTRSGSVLRIAPLKDLQTEEDDSLKLALAKKNLQPLTVKLIPVSYAKLDDLEKQIKPFLSTRGTAVSDNRTSAVVVSDIEDNLDRIMKLVQSIDIPPQQVLIEGKVVEASNTFSRDLGVNWSTGGLPVSVGSSTQGPTYTNFQTSIQPSLNNNATGTLNFSLGVLDVLGTLNAALNVQEQEGNVKVLSSPRVVTLHNEAAEISQSQELPIITSTPTTTGQPIPTVSYKTIKLDLKVTPNVTNDGSVIMSVDVLREFPGAVANTATGAVPVNGRAAKTKVMVHNGQTAVIGGIYENDTTESESRVPWLGSVPVLGWLFKSNSKQEQRNELLIFLTPRILGHLDSQTIPQQNEGEKL